MYNAPVKNNQLLHEAYQRGYRQGLNEQVGSGRPDTGGGGGQRQKYGNAGIGSSPPPAFQPMSQDAESSTWQPPPPYDPYNMLAQYLGIDPAEFGAWWYENVSGAGWQGWADLGFTFVGEGGQWGEHAWQVSYGDGPDWNGDGLPDCTDCQTTLTLYWDNGSWQLHVTQI